MVKFSIVTINRNNEKGLADTLESVKSQLFTDYELIVVDGGSTDGSLKCIDEYSSVISKVIHQEGRGIYQAMNLGLVNCHGEFVIFMNSGDSFYNELTLEISSKHCIDEMCVYFGRAKIIWKDELSWITPSIEEDIDINKWLRKNLPSHQSIYFPKCFYKANLYDEKFKICGDLEYKLRAQRALGKFNFIDSYPISVCTLGGVSTSYGSLKTVFRKTYEAYLAQKDYCSTRLEILSKTSFLYFIQLSKFLLSFVFGSDFLYRFMFFQKKASENINKP
jgi:putative colanic acid biosynthesis glycosyltransferase